MADIALSAVITMAVEIAANLVISEGSGLYWLQEHINWIEREMKRIQSYLEDADAKEVRGRGVANLINDIKDLAHDVEDVLDKFLPQMASRKRKTGLLSCARTSTCTLLTCNCYVERKFAMEIEKIRQRVADIDRSRTTYGITSDGDRAEKDAWDSRRPFLHADEQHIIGFDKDIQKLEAKLLNVESKYDVISIVGMPGLGKTTLAKKVFKSIKHRFECSAMVYVSQEPNPREIMKDIARQVGLDQKEKREEYLETSLYEFLEEKRYIIMLDDIWDNETWDAMKICIPIKFANGGRILLTSRNSGVGRYIGGESSLHELVPLNPNDSWKLFSKMVMDPVRNTDEVCVPPELNDVSRQIIERCGGLPLAIVLTTSLLLSREKTEHAWKGVLGNMGQGEGDKLTKILDLSYKDLPIRLKPCFLYFGLFPESHEISVFQLVNLWVAEKLISASETSGDRTVEDMGEDYLNNLVSRNLIQVVSRRFDGRIRSCRIHDVLHNFCISIAVGSNFFNTLSNISSHSSMRVRRFTTHLSSITKLTSLKHQTPKLRGLLCFNKEGILGVEQPRKIFKEFIFLRVLSIECRLGQYLSVPNEIGNFIHFSYLGLSGNWHAKFPATICNLKNLLTLDAGKCMLLSLPTSIWQMKQLRHLILPATVVFHTPIVGGCKIKNRDMLPIEASLPDLQTLFLVCDDRLRANWLYNFVSLRKLGISYSTEQIIEVLSASTPISDKLENMRLVWSLLYLQECPMTKFDFSHYQNLYKLHLEGSMGKLPNPDTFPPNLTKLTLRMTAFDEESMEAMKKLPKLRILKMQEGSYKGKSIVCFGVQDFPQLEVLQIRGEPHLEELVTEESAMPKLRKLTISSCKNLSTLSERLRNIMDDGKIV
ncbi:hypothetical protein RJ640_024292 [Escallonia rubra]|uniref:AAA+ ATPase domain-containing protein n=1 Tax=Escallonia rubra TaxID=112253 RepID=A0AA88RLR4_9ASTE|nr:hypothetical protein RJ640_024292 [Escallonia rubra]